MSAPDYLLARAVESAVFSAGMLALSLAESSPADSERWMRHADKLEAKYTTQHGEHYCTTIERGFHETD